MHIGLQTWRRLEIVIIGYLPRCSVQTNFKLILSLGKAQKTLLQASVKWKHSKESNHRDNSVILVKTWATVMLCIHKTTGFYDYSHSGSQQTRFHKCMEITILQAKNTNFLKRQWYSAPTPIQGTRVAVTETIAVDSCDFYDFDFFSVVLWRFKFLRRKSNNLVLASHLRCTESVLHHSQLNLEVRISTGAAFKGNQLLWKSLALVLDILEWCKSSEIFQIPHLWLYTYTDELRVLR